MGTNSPAGVLGLALVSFVVAFVGFDKLIQRQEAEVSKRNAEEEQSEDEDRKVRLCTYNIRGFFDYYSSRKPLLRAALAEICPDILAVQEIMVNSAGQDHFITRCLDSACAEGVYRCFSHAAILTYLRSAGAPPSLSPLKAKILMTIIEAQNIVLGLPFLGAIIARLPRYLEYPRYAFKRLWNVDLMEVYYPLYAPIWGLSTLVGPKMVVLEEAVLPLRTEPLSEHMGTAHRMKIKIPSGHLIWVVNIHLDSTTEDGGSQIRELETQLIIEWMAPVTKDVDATFVVGDNNTLLEKETLLETWAKNGYESAHKLVHNEEPTKTWPSGISCGPFTDVDGNPGCLDYIWVLGAEKLEFHHAALGGTDSHPHDDTLYASDHYALWTEFSFKHEK
mmetsp:Transcript_1497/g.2283  ORF Transcript_1497/g.2283 Transcript_1497/m.2283 type:complete len:390 (-) Transcript_1497:79-1248(-)